MGAIVISAFPGTGKSHFTSIVSPTQNFKVLDLDSSTYSQSSLFPKNYILTVRQLINEYDIIFISTHDMVREELNKYNIEYFLIYPSNELKGMYINRYKKRGDTDKFINLISNNWNEYIKSCSTDNSKNCKLHLTLTNDNVIYDYFNLIKLFIDSGGLNNGTN